MKVAIACDHRGYEAKRKLLPVIKRLGHEVVDFGCDSPAAVDYPEMAAIASRAVAGGEAEVGILLDGSGVGMSIASNKIKGIRAALIHDDVTARRSREHNHCNVLCLGCDLLSEDQIRTITEVFLSAVYGDGRHARRVDMISELEKKSMTGDNVFQLALSKLLVEIFDGALRDEAYVLNGDDIGLLNQIDALTADIASSRPTAGKTTIASHVAHVHYGISLLNRWAAGEENPWASADWSATWQRPTLTDEQWKNLRANLRQAAKLWQKAVAERTDWNVITATGALSSASHTAYHLGAIRQILAALQK